MKGEPVNVDTVGQTFMENFILLRGTVDKMAIIYDRMPNRPAANNASAPPVRQG